MHELRIEHNDLAMARPWGIYCSCGFTGSAADEQEAKRIAEHHKHWEQQKAKLKEKGFL